LDAGARGGDSESDGVLRCQGCAAVFPLELGCPVLIPEGALTGVEWEVWREHLAKFQARRETRIENPDELITKRARRINSQPAFAEFVGIDTGTVLDVGCGPGKFRHHFDAERVRYVGLDPLHLAEVRDFPFVQGLAEYLPFKRSTFTDIVVLAALDHFRNLDRFLDEAQRVLVPGGRLHLLQSVHELRGPISAVKVVGHKVKDALEDRWTKDTHGRHVPKHLEEFTRRSLVERFSGTFEMVSAERYSATWYSPDKLFMTLESRASASSIARPA
jgi:ubiquinone/menaquinone biosynthesis C-methylase UbiE